MLLADIGLGEVLWSLLVILFMVVYFMMLFSIIVDLFRDQETSGVAKAVWLVLLLVFPLATMLAYVITRGEGMSKRSAAQAKATEVRFQDYIRETAGVTPADHIARAKQLLDEGAINAEEYEALKKKALA